DYSCAIGHSSGPYIF
nr:immunoglobulin light chain junction region [Macaca mulatta]MOV66735.1 immunoglobulin light chain junction region [Macaca mulatta]MOV67407.1 immunoglobulin light chain junction region [Macaca mulatta]MOV67752.1 immunoglobulin light chain junction region [Macaca mulatta]MOV67811.1 immunoglobulin light chain junction region [Macaca mulatta]